MAPEHPNNDREKQPTRERPDLRLVAREAGLDLDAVNPRIKERLELLHQKTLTVADEYVAIKMAKAVFAYYGASVPERSLSEEEERTVTVGTLFTDIGKTGPREAPRELQECITEIFGIDDHVEQTTPLESFLNTYFSADAARRAELLRRNGLDPAMTMRQFWDRHSLWTLEIIKGDGVPPEAIAGAATHHILEGVNPEKIVGDDGTFTKNFGHNTSLNRPEKLVIALDKYQAALRRGGKTHAEAIERLRTRIGTNSRFKDDAEFAAIIGDLDAALKNYKESGA